VGQTNRLLDLRSRQLNETVVVTSDNNGNATFIFATPPQGNWKTGTLNCAGAGPGASFAAAVGATPWGSWQGFTVFGPVQAQENQILTVTASALTPNSVYEMTWIGSVDPSEILQPISPDSNSNSIASVNIYGAVLSLINLPGNTGLTMPYSSGVPKLLPSTLNLAGFALWLGAATDVTITLTAGSLEWQETIANPNPFLPVIIPLAVQGGQSWALTLANVGTGSNNINGLVLQGLGQLPPTVPVAGQPLAVTPRGGALKVSVAGGVGNTTLLAAAPTGMVYRLHSIGAYNNVTLWSDNGFTFAVTGGAAAGSPSPNLIMEGLICVGPIVADNTGGVAQATYLAYDLIPIQEVI
jgi:hypothetical protein